MRCVLAFCVLLASSVSADAATITYTSSAAFFAALDGTPTTTETYEGLPLNGTIAAGETVNGITYVSFPPSTSGRIAGAEFNRIGAQSLALGGSQQFFSADQSMTVSFAPSTAIGIFFNAALSLPNSFYIQTPVGSAFNGAGLDLFNLYFVGLISDSPFSSATIGATSAAASGYNLDNLTLARAATPVPEPASMFLLGSGLLALRMRARRSRSL